MSHHHQGSQTVDETAKLGDQGRDLRTDIIGSIVQNVFEQPCHPPDHRHRAAQWLFYVVKQGHHSAANIAGLAQFCTQLLELALGIGTSRGCIRGQFCASGYRTRQTIDEFGE